jgi:hypothetical protein
MPRYIWNTVQLSVLVGIGTAATGRVPPGW